MQIKTTGRDKESNRQADEERKLGMIKKWEEEFFKEIGDDLMDKQDEDLDKYGKINNQEKKDDEERKAKEE